MIYVQSKKGRIQLAIEGKKSEILSDLACITLTVLREIGGTGPYFEHLPDLTSKDFVEWIVKDDVEEAEEE